MRKGLPRTLQVIEYEIDIGTGGWDDPYRTVLAYSTTDGTFLATGDDPEASHRWRLCELLRVAQTPEEKRELMEILRRGGVHWPDQAFPGL